MPPIPTDSISLTPGHDEVFGTVSATAAGIPDMLLRPDLYFGPELWDSFLYASEHGGPKHLTMIFSYHSNATSDIAIHCEKWVPIIHISVPPPLKRGTEKEDGKIYNIFTSIDDLKEDKPGGGGLISVTPPFKTDSDKLYICELPNTSHSIAHVDLKDTSAMPAVSSSQSWANNLAECLLNPNALALKMNSIENWLVAKGSVPVKKDFHIQPSINPFTYRAQVFVPLDLNAALNCNPDTCPEVTCAKNRMRREGNVDGKPNQILQDTVAYRWCACRPPL
jgi:hypothetical protein